MVGLVESVPKTLYSKFVIDERHGFNKMTIGLFISDTIKSTLLSLLFGAPIVALLIKIMQWGGPNFYIYVFVFLVILIFLLMWIIPNFIMPLFNKYEDIEDGSLKTKIQDLAKGQKFPLTKLFKMDGSKRSDHSNAFLFGFGSNKRIVLFDTLITQSTEEEIIAVLAHEIGHWKMWHTFV